MRKLAVHVFWEFDSRTDNALDFLYGLGGWWVGGGGGGLGVADWDDQA